MNQELQDIQAGFIKGRGTGDQTRGQHQLDHRKSKRIPENMCFIDFTKTFVWITTNCGKFLEMEIPDHVTCLLRNLYAGQEAS